MHRFRKSLRSQIIENPLHVPFKIVSQRTEMAHQQRVSSSGSVVFERAVGELRQRPPLTFLLKEDILSTSSKKNDTM